MSNSLRVFDEISDKIIFLSQKIEVSNKLNLTGEANFAEDIFGRILNVIFKWDLQNSNIQKSNKNTIDLYDEAKHVCVQITSNKNFSVKKTHTLDGFKTSSDLKKFKHLHVVFLRRNIPVKILEYEQLNASQDFQGHSIDTILAKIKVLKPERSNLILEILRREIDPIKNLPEINDREIKRLKDIQPKNLKEGIIVDRSETVRKLFDLARQGHCLVIGKPGIGKSFTLNEFNAFCWNSNCIAVTIKINELVSGSEEEISDLLEVEGNWLGYLNAIKTNISQFLIFDAYDTAKNEILKPNILKRIREALKKLVPSWHIIVSVRTYDAQKSKTLMEMFSENGKPKTFEIVELTNNELHKSLQEHRDIRTVYLSCKKELKEIIRIPYFLKIFEEVVLTNNVDQLKYLKAIKTEVQLLDIYWKRKITSRDDELECEKTLLIITTILFENKNLNVDRNVVLPLVNINILTELIREGFFLQTGNIHSTISFTHNILFDYAIARLILKKDVPDFIEQIAANTQNPFIFRPSYWYLLNEMWTNQRKDFWKLYFLVYESDKEGFKIIHQMLFNPVIAACYKNIQEIKPLLDNQKYSNNGILVNKFLQATKFSLNNRLATREVELSSYLSTRPQVEFLWMLGSFINTLIKNKIEPKISSKASAKYLSYILEIRNEDLTRKTWIDRIGSVWGGENVCIGYIYNRQESGILIGKILNLLNEEDFEIGYFFNLCQNFKLLLSINPSVAKNVFQKIYLHNENSKKETNFGGGAILNLRSNRQQDFGSCYHQLEELYPAFLTCSPLIALKLGIKLINVLKEKEAYQKAKPIRVKINEINSIFLSDGSIGDFNLIHLEGINKINASLFDFLSKVAEDRQVFDQYMEILLKETKIGFLWKEIINFLKLHITKTKSYAAGLLQNDIFYFANETAYETAELLRTLVPILSINEVSELEKKIIALSNGESKNPDFEEYRVVRMLSVFPKELLQFEKSKEIVAKNEGYKNAPLIEYSGFERIEREHDFAKEKGIDVKAKENSALYAICKTAERLILKFEHENNMSRANIADLSKIIYEIQNSVPHENTHNELMKYAEETTAKLIKIISRERKLIPPKNRKKILFLCRSILNKNKLITKENLQTVGPRFTYSQNTRTDISEALLNFCHFYDIPEISEIIIELLDDNEAIIRANAAKCLYYFYKVDLNRFWQIIIDRSGTKEEDEVFKYNLLRNVCYSDLITSQPQSIDKILELSFPDLTKKSFSPMEGYMALYINLLFSAVRLNESTKAKEILTQAYSNTNFAKTAIMTILNEGNLPSLVISNKFKYFLIQELYKIIDTHVEILRHESLEQVTRMEHFKTLDTLITRISFFSRKDHKNAISDSDFYFLMKPIINHFIAKSEEIDGGVMVSQTGYYLSQYLETHIMEDPDGILKMIHDIVVFSSKTGFSNDTTTLKTVIQIIELYLSDYKDIAFKEVNLKYTINLLSIFAESGWQEALELIWRLNEIFSD